jgi:hypothetical protein
MIPNPLSNNPGIVTGSSLVHFVSPTTRDERLNFEFRISNEELRMGP